MRYLVLATDYDGTLAEDGIVSSATLEALERARQSGRHLFLVTGRELPDLKATFPQFEIFERIVAENGALLYDPKSGTETVLCQAPPARFAETLERKGVRPLSVGRVIVSTWTEQKLTVLQTVEELGLELQLIFNKGSLMILPTGVNKSTGLNAALADLGLSAKNTVGIGDAENDHAFLSACERAVSVANALPALKEKSDWVTTHAAGQGVSELIDRLIREDLRGMPANDGRDSILLGESEQGDVRLPGYGASILLAGASGGDKSTLTIGVMERLSEAGYQFCAIDPQGDYQSFEGAVILGGSNRAPTVEEAVAVLEKPEQNLILNLLEMSVDERPTFYESLLPRLEELRTRTGRPHWLILDEAHHPAPRIQDSAPEPLLKKLNSALLITLQPDHLSQTVLALIDTVVAVGEKPEETIAKFCRASGVRRPAFEPQPVETGKALLWSRSAGGDPIPFTVAARTRSGSGTR